MAKPTIAQAGKAADDYLALKAAQAELAKKEDELKKVMLAFGRDVIEGHVARVTVSRVPGRVSIDMDAVQKLLPPKVFESLKKQGAPSIRFAAKARMAESKVGVTA